MNYSLKTPEELSSHIRALRKARRLSQTELAAQLGVNQSRIAVIEKKPGAVSVNQFFKLLNALNCSVSLQDNSVASGVPSGLAPSAALAQ